MAINDLAPWNWGKKPVRTAETTQDPLARLQQRMDAIFDSFWDDLDGMARRTFGEGLITGAFSPDLDVVETDNGFTVKAELPGMTEEDIEVSLADGGLTISGEKREEKQEENHGVHCSECSYGSFSRQIRLSAEIDEDKVTAEFKNGVLLVSLPKVDMAADTGKRIQVKRG